MSLNKIFIKSGILLILIFSAWMLIGCQNSSQASTAFTSQTIDISSPSPTSGLLDISEPVNTAVPTSTVTQDLPPSPTATSTITPTPAPTLTPTQDVRLDPSRWTEWPAIPTVSARAHEIYQQGLANGNDPQSFSRVGDCESAPEAFLGFYVEEWAWLPTDYQYLQAAIDHFHASFARDNITARDGFGVSSVLSPLMSDPSVCNNSETPLECEYRLYRPSLIFISMGTNWAPYAGDSYEKYLRQVVEFSIDHGVLPVLMTKADNLELDNSINAAIARVAYDYDIPMLNFWRVAHSLPHNGLEDDGAHLTTEAEDSRNFYGLLTLYTVWDKLTNWGQPGY